MGTSLGQSWYGPRFPKSCRLLPNTPAAQTSDPIPGPDIPGIIRLGKMLIPLRNTLFLGSQINFDESYQG